MNISRRTLMLRVQLTSTTVQSIESCNFCTASLTARSLLTCFSDSELIELTEVKTEPIMDVAPELDTIAGVEPKEEQMTEPNAQLEEKQMMELNTEEKPRLSMKRIRRTSSEETYQCDKCSHSFQRECSLVRHVRYACGKEPRFKCPYCIYRCYWQFHIYVHVRKYHRKRPVCALDIVNNCINEPRILH